MDLTSTNELRDKFYHEGFKTLSNVCKETSTQYGFIENEYQDDDSDTES